MSVRLSRRLVMVNAFGWSAALALESCASPSADMDAIVTHEPSGTVPAYPSLAAAVAAAPPNATRPHIIHIARGIWRERVVIDKPFIRLVGEERDACVVVSDRYAGVPGTDGRPVGTFDTATITVKAPDFSAMNLTIANDFDYPARAATSGGSQAVALAVQESADRSLFAAVKVTGYQDSLFVNTGRSLFVGCRIEGCVDFIFGAGRARFDRCEIVSRRRGEEAYIAAPDTDIRQPYGLIFNECRVTREAGVPAGSVALGRPWRHTRHFADGTYGDPDNVGAAAYVHCWLDDHIRPDGWTCMDYNAKGGGRATLPPSEARFFEFDSTGPGANPSSPARRQLTAAQAEAFVSRVLEGWIIPTA
jgi:pectinesterase